MSRPAGRASRSVKADHAALATLAAFFLAFWVISLHYKFSPVVFPIGKARLWDVAVEGTMWTWANVAVLVTGANACALRAYAVWRAGGRLLAWLGWLATAAVIAALSLDDLVALHERLDPLGRSWGYGSGFTHFAWVIPGLIAAAGCVLVVGAHALRLPAAPRAYLLGGVGFLFAGAIGLEMVSGANLAANGHTKAYVMIYHVEELFEAIGAALLLCAPLSDMPPEARWLRRTA